MSFSFLGTPLSRSTSGDFIPLWKQEARDEQGRKRFHGAFTGGFTAGYHNTVGSREGWAPASFVSSRRERHSNKGSHSRVEDFMDEEDLRELQRGTGLVTTETYATVPEKGRVRARRSGIGWELLRKMIAISNESKTGPVGRDEQERPLCPGIEDISTLPSPVMTLLSSRRPPRGTPRERPKTSGIGVSVLEEDDDVVVEDLMGGHVSAAYDLDQSSVQAPRRRPRLKNKVSRDRKDCLAGFARAMAPYQEIQYPSLRIPDDFIEKLPQRSQHQPAGRLMTIGANLSVEQRGRLLTGETPRVVSISTKITEMVPQMTAAPASLPPLKLDVTTSLNAQQGFMPFTAIPEKDARYRQFLAHFVNPQSVPLPSPPVGVTPVEHERELREFMQAATVFRPLPSQMASKFVRGKVTETVGTTEARSGLYRPRALEGNLTDVRGKSSMDSPMTTGTRSSPEPMITDKTVSTTANEVEKKNEEKEEKETVPSRSEITWVPSALLCKRFGVEPPAEGSAGQQPRQQPTASQSNAKPILSAQSLKSIIAGTEWAGKIDLSALANAEEQEQQQRQQHAIEATARAAEQSIAMPEQELHERPSMDLFKSIFGEDASDTDGFPPLPVSADTSSRSQDQLAKIAPPSSSSPVPASASTSVEEPSLGSLAGDINLRPRTEPAVAAPPRSSSSLPQVRVRSMAATLMDEGGNEEKGEEVRNNKDNTTDDCDGAEGQDTTTLMRRKRPAAADLW